ncbi:hypothetical protein BASA50_008513 [Batrachochytrium salamandrivorans]|uniref:Reverse transcriptase domain-containing protein n=1 Tax=Batrachochytrium salamandrivorans TaxID=1357716 RepID=A0ABQ8F3X7_9FUNG|nr:hypothetical protein BASA50_008513 [Batrachochytrium salamandrivorans]
MQFFHLFSFVVVASYAAALPQPAGLSEKYSNNDSATLVSLKRRDDSEELSEDNSEDNSEAARGSFAEIDFSSKNLASTIKIIKGGAYILFDSIEKAGQRFDGPVGGMVEKYLSKSIHVNFALRRWGRSPVSDILGLIRSNLGEDEYSKIEPYLTEIRRIAEDESNAGFDAISNATTNILEDVGSGIENLQNTNTLVERALLSQLNFISVLRFWLKFEAGATLRGWRFRDRWKTEWKYVWSEGFRHQANLSAGFRKREECVGQVVSLVDIIQRRQNSGLNTHVLFIDIRKAFDTVPVGALLWKLQNMGFPRRTLAFLKALYTSSSARARAGSLLSDPFPVQRGVRQGCPLSGLLFNLFINDILDGVEPITVPGLPRDTNPIRGLMYADDVAVFADSEQSLLAASTAIEQWANRWEMQFGVAKCGIISFTGHLAPRLDNPLDIRLHGQLVSRVESYKYLGVLIDSKLDHSAWLKQKRSALEHTISALHPVLANHQLTVNYRSRIFSAVVMGKAYYGLELVGGNKSHLAPLQTTINKGIRLFTGARLSTAIGPLLVETGIGSLLTRSLVSRVRLLERSVTKRTPINAICSGTDNDVFTLNVQGQLVRSQRWFWSRRTKQLYRNRYWLTPQVRPKTVKQRHSFALMETLRTCGDSASLQKYVTRQLLDTSGFFKDPSFDQSRAHGTRYLMLARMDALWTARKAIQIGILVDTHPFSVDHCILCDQQLLSTSIAHLVVECEQVTGHRIQSGLVPAIQKSRLRLLGRALDPGVENVYTWLRGGVLNGEADLDQRWLDGTVEHESMGTRHDNRALAARLADFLQVAYRQYQSTLWKYHRDRLVEVG